MATTGTARIGVDDVCVGSSRRAINEASVLQLATSMQAIGLQHPITVRHVDRFIDPVEGEVENAVALVAGRHRLEAARRLGWKTIDCIYQSWDERQARMWEIAENLHRADLSELDRKQQIAEWIRLADKPGQNAPVSIGGRGNEGGVRKASLELGIERTEVRRALKVDGITPEAKEAAKEAKIDDNTAKLLIIAETPPDEQVAKVAELATKSARAAIDGDVRQRAARALAEWIIEHANGNDLDAVKANLFTVGAKSIAVELTNLLGESIMDRRYGDTA